MIIPPQYKITSEILDIISQIEANRIFLNSIPIPSGIKNKIERISFLKSSLYSARIEGNPLTLEELYKSPDKLKKLEVFNILRAIRFTGKNIKPGEKMTYETILTLHKIVVKDILGEGGIFRSEMGAIFNSAGIAVYISPPPKEIKELISKLLEYINSSSEKLPLITAFISHLIFEKIHPFIDGNGRVGRLFVFSILRAKKWNFPVFIPLEEYLDKHKEDYYYFLDNGFKATEDYLLFMLQAFLSQTETLKSEIKLQLESEDKIFLPPRQDEIYNIIRDHKIISFDTIKRRFLKVPARTLRYDLKKLHDKGLIIKIGETRGSYYSVKEKSKEII